MLHKTKGIVLSFVKYRETSIIVKVFTEKFGLKSYLVNSVRTANSKNNKIAFFQPFTLLDLVVYNHKNTSLHRISEVRLSYPFSSIPYQISKSTVCIFLTEVLCKIFDKEEVDNIQLFDYLEDSICFFDQVSENFQNFHLQFLIRLSHFLGISISSAKEVEAQLFEAQFPAIPEILKQNLTDLIKTNYSQKVLISSENRRELLNYLLQFYTLYFPNLKHLKSLIILKEL